ncbi:MAG TPA: hypothetical protein DHV30_04365 [Balneola sp.]|nr:hypothetical protein [Balneola sp.]|tara:strand:+ start:173 stop:841 length:669 start_codon:yes stop_codon:yes gene_type:complete
MKITKQKLKEIIKEEISNALVEFDLDSELTSIGTGVDSVNKKKAHENVALGLMQASIALNLMLELATQTVDKESRFFAENMPHGPSRAYKDEIEKIARILSTVSKQVSNQGQSLEENYIESELARENENMKELINYIDKLGTEMKIIGLGGVTPEEKEVDNLILAKLKLSIGTFGEIVKNHIYAILEQFRDLSGEKLVPERLRNYLDNAPTSEIFAPMRQKL